MAENQEGRSGEDLTEEASPQRLEDARKKGSVAQSRELSSVTVLMAVSVATFILAPKKAELLTEFMRETFTMNITSRVDFGTSHGPGIYLIKALKVLAAVGLPVCLIGFLSGVVSSFAQIGVIFSWDPLTPDFNRINPLQGFQRLISFKQIMESVRLLLKTVIVLAVSYTLLKPEILSSISNFGLGPDSNEESLLHEW